MPKKSTTPLPKTLQIKVRACERLFKEHEYYKEEVRQNESKLVEMREQNRDKYDIKKFQEVLDESHMMVPDSFARYIQNLDDLSAWLDEFGEDESIKGEGSAEWLSKARTMLEARVDADDSAPAYLVETNVDDLKDDEAF